MKKSSDRRSMGMVKKLIIFILVVFTVIPFIFGENNPAEETVFDLHKEALGFQAGELAGYGLSYFKEMENGKSIQFAGGAYYGADIGFFESLLNYNLGVELHFPVYRDEYSRFFAGQLYIFTGLNHNGYINNEWNTISEEYERGGFNTAFSSGFGIGIELILFRHFSIPLELGYVASWTPTLAGDFLDQFGVNLRPQGGFRYRY
ncbi:MAG: hypothetical protein JEY99_06855 [Spirochaetales bacterium]|nr:hypothetical protein [Spirochaetales bacterium]